MTYQYTPPPSGEVEEDESARIGVIAEDVAEWSRRLSSALLESTGEGLLDRLRVEADVLRTLVDGAESVDGKQPVAAPYRDRKGRLRNLTNPVLSARNPIAPPMTLIKSGAESEFSVTLPIQFQGPPKTLHGGFVSVLLDETLWHAVRTASGGMSFTRELTVSYERPVPLAVPLAVRGRVTSVDGRKTYAEGEILADGLVCAHASGLWIAPRPRVEHP
ncbi:PaaI family thioesterase [Gordonia sp. CPCC 206044]|uniref:PaaI family thioesterase n=1 Tax=Gordonia sp. CPCC 206044 TaxID=3140793 RepID=UPI003AF3D819